MEKQEEKFDIIFLDPPYHKGLSRKSLINLDAYDILSPTGLVIAEHFKKDNLTLDLDKLILEKERIYGDTIIKIFRRKRWAEPK